VWKHTRKSGQDAPPWPWLACWPLGTWVRWWHARVARASVLHGKQRLKWREWPTGGGVVIDEVSNSVTYDEKRMACHQGHRGSTSYRWWEGINFNEPDRNLMGAGAIFHLTLFRSGSSFWSTRPEPDPLPSLNTGMWGGSDLHMTNSSSHCRTVAPTCWYWGGGVDGCGA
jgi:hypothetical protein